ncbi:MAG: transglutaminase family protein [Planctomycetaceae bacterium]|nr:transglutaminase family protein [Planctomycetaceae bacterium]
MSIRVALNHKTEYDYDRPVTLTPQVVRLRPAPHCRTPIVGYSLKVHPRGHFINWQQDPYSNYLARLVFPEPTREFRVEVDVIAELSVINPFDFFLESTAERYPFEYEPVLARELNPYLEKEPAGPRLRALVEELRRGDIRTVDYLVEINRRLSHDVKYLIRMEPGIQTCEETLAQGSGSCRDTGWLLVQILRHLGLAARFVSGYLIQLKPDVKPLDGPSGVEQDFTDLHAWTEVYVPGAGWIGLDPTSGLLAGEGHIPLACAADPLSASPISGSFFWTKDRAREQDDRCEPEFHFHMTLTRIHEDPRVTKPYTEDQWRAIVDLGHRIDERLRAGDVRLTMGGEPTFVSVDDMDGAEWNTTALGPAKRVQAGLLLTRLRDRFAPGGILHHGQGKWYPGESLPRWVLSCHWRRDGIPVWEDPALIADESINYGYRHQEARRFSRGLAERLGVDPAHSMPGYEDVWYYLWRERRLPVNVDPKRSELEDPEGRRRLHKVFERGLDHVVGYALPLRRDRSTDEPLWASGPWVLRTEHLFLIPGDSPMGYRLPLDSIPWASPGEIEPVLERDPFAPREPLASREALSRQRRIVVPPSGPWPGRPRELEESPTPYPVDQSAAGVVRTALCVEPRDGRLYIFMPPLGLLEDYLELVAAVEDTARELHLPVLMEGYLPPRDHRMNHLSVTPDPGVIEVNLHPAQGWDELVEQTTTLYEEARQARLGTEKFMIDGRHSGTGGGNHVVIGGPTPADSPILRRPDLLRSLVAYWNNHPSLSYLFSGLFVGPTSQAPRVDEGRDDSLDEMEIAFRQIPDHGGCPPWIVDRVFRDLLVDVTGNTHRAEFCIDKLYSPETSGGRQGLVEMRAFEMPPHSRMSLVQQLLIRSLIARFWEQPYESRLVRWGTELHDRFMLPHFVRQDFEDVIVELRESGLPLQHEWFEPHFEFRFPCFGRVDYRGVELQLRQAIEPWHVLGEENAPGSTVRYVDSSVERLELKVKGMTDARHVVTCNGRRVPLHPTGTNGEFVAGIRFRAWQPPSCLHPTIPVHAPLVFDLVDTWMGRSSGGFTYHVSHPGGRAFDTFPVNAYEAESRRTSRFVPFGHTPGPMEAPIDERNSKAPLTLDLRRSPRS